MAISKDSDDMVDPGQAGKPDLAAWRAEAGAALEGASKATPGEWFFDSYSSVHSKPRVDEGDALERLIPDDAPDDDPRWAALPESGVCQVPCIAGDTGTAQGAHDARFIAAARTGWPRDAARVGVLVDMLARARAVLDALPHCLGTWVKGSGGHCVYANDCRKIATVYEDGADGYNFCDEHGARNILDKFREEYLWADAVRALDAASAKEPNR